VHLEGKTFRWVVQADANLLVGCSFLSRGRPLQFDAWQFVQRGQIFERIDWRLVAKANANLNVGTEEPASYIERLKIREAELEKQCIPMDRELWRASRYRDFLRQRRKLLAKTTNEFLQL